MKNLSSFACRVAIAVLCSSQLARASDWYVDAVNGNNANTGTSATTAWRTITYAVANTPTTGQQRIYVAAGHYDEALGETFPLVMRDQLQLIGAGPDATEFINNGPFSVVGIMPYHALVLVRGTQPGTLLQGFRISSTLPLTINHPRWGVYVQTYGGGCDVEFREMRFDSLAYAFYVDSNSNQNVATVHGSKVEILQTRYGVALNGHARLYADDFRFEGNSDSALWCGGASGTSILSLSRSRIVGTPYWALSAGAGNYPYPYGHHHDSIVDISDSLIARNGTPGFSVPAIHLANGTAGSNLGSLQVNITRCTIAENEVGIAEDHATLSIDSCLLQNNADDLSYVTAPTISYSNISDGDFAGTNGNISAPATFIDPVNGDYRLAFGSPGIDIGNPATPAGTLDIMGTARPVDGDLDTIERCDIGAFEFAPLFRTGGAQLGSLMRLELRGPQGASSALFWTRAALAATPVSTPYGQYDMQIGLGHLYAIVTVGPVLPGLVQRTIPNAAFLVGQTFAFQALTDNPLAPSGKAYTNGVQFTILP